MYKQPVKCLCFDETFQVYVMYSLVFSILIVHCITIKYISTFIVTTRMLRISTHRHAAILAFTHVSLNYSNGCLPSNERPDNSIHV